MVSSRKVIASFLPKFEMRPKLNLVILKNIRLRKMLANGSKNKTPKQMDLIKAKTAILRGRQERIKFGQAVKG